MAVSAKALTCYSPALPWTRLNPRVFFPLYLPFCPPLCTGRKGSGEGRADEEEEEEEEETLRDKQNVASLP